MKKKYYELIEEMAADFIEYTKEQADEDIRIDNHNYFHDWVSDYWHSAWGGFLREEIFDDFDTELTTAAKIIEISDEVATDSGLWEGQEPKDAIISQAYYTGERDFTFAIQEIAEEEEIKSE